MQIQRTFWLEKVLKMISLYVSALLCTLQHIAITRDATQRCQFSELTPLSYIACYDNMLQRAQKCTDVQGDHFQHIL